MVDCVANTTNEAVCGSGADPLGARLPPDEKQNAYHRGVGHFGAALHVVTQNISPRTARRANARQPRGPLLGWPKSGHSTDWVWRRRFSTAMVQAISTALLPKCGVGGAANALGPPSPVIDKTDAGLPPWQVRYKTAGPLPDSWHTASAVLHAIWHIKIRLFGQGCVANPRDTYGYRCGLRLALTKNPSFLFAPSSMQHCTSIHTWAIYLLQSASTVSSANSARVRPARCISLTTGFAIRGLPSSRSMPT